MTETLAVDVASGLFTTYIGIDPFVLDGNIWLGIEVENDGEMPRFLLATSPYAAVAELCGDAITLQGLDPSTFADTAHTHDYADIQSHPADQDTTYQGGNGITINGANDIEIDPAIIQTEARAACYDTELELNTDLDDDYADIGHAHAGVYEPVHGHPYSAISHNHAGVYATVGHTHAPPALDCVHSTTSFNFTGPGTITLNVTCAVGRHPTGGGIDVAGAVNHNDFHLFRSRPNIASRRWEVGVATRDRLEPSEH